MIEYCYPECTTSAITSLAVFRKHYPDYKSKEIEYAFCFVSGTILQLYLVQSNNLFSYQVSVLCPTAVRWLDWVLGNLLHICHDVRVGKSLVGGQDI